MNKRELAARVLGTAPARALMRLVGKPGLVCLTYHRIGELDDLDPSIISCSFEELEWQARWLQGQVLQGQLDYWRLRLSWQEVERPHRRLHLRRLGDAQIVGHPLRW